MASADGGGTLHRAFLIVRWFALVGNQFTIREIAAGIDVPVTSVHRICKLLVNEGILVFDPVTTMYSWGPEAKLLAQTLRDGSGLQRATLPTMRSLVGRFGETALLVVYVPAKRSIRFAQEIECDEAIRYRAPLNRDLPIHAGASGKAVLAFLPSDEIEQVIESGLLPLTENTVTDPDLLRRQLADVRRRRVCVSTGERASGAVGIAAPLFVNGKIEGALMLTLPSYRASKSKVAEIEEAVRRHAEQITNLMSRPSYQANPSLAFGLSDVVHT